MHETSRVYIILPQVYHELITDDDSTWSQVKGEKGLSKKPPMNSLYPNVSELG